MSVAKQKNSPPPKRQTNTASILVVDDERAIRDTIKEILQSENYRVSTADNASTAQQLLQQDSFDVALCDIKMPGIDGLELLDIIVQQFDMPVIMISGHGTIDTAVEAIKKGAFDYIEKPLDLNRLLVAIRNAVDRGSLVKETKTLRKKIAKSYEIIGNSKPISDIKEIITRVAPTAARVLITGENGTGKELVARQIHQLSQLENNSFVEVNCAAIPTELIESELFGHEKGAFTSAIKQRIGKFEQADGGTLFLDEIGDMSLSAQSKVLRALQENRITRVGGDKEIQVAPRILAATNKNLLEEIEKGNFREDLYHRLSVILIHVPPLRERTEDIPLLVDAFLTKISSEYGKPKRKIDSAAIAYLEKMPWPGNIRELQNVIERLVILTDSTITLRDVEKYIAM